MGEWKSIGDRAMWLESGHIKDIGDTDRVVTKYLAAMFEKDTAYLSTAHRNAQHQSQGPGKAPEIVESIPNIDHRFGEVRDQWLGIPVLDLSGRPIHLLTPSPSLSVVI